MRPSKNLPGQRFESLLRRVSYGMGEVDRGKRRSAWDQGGERLGGETSGSERKGVMQWTGSKLKSETKRKRYAAKFGDLMELKEEYFIHALLLFIT